MNLRKYFKIYSKFLYTSLASEFEYKANIVIDFITALWEYFLLSISKY